MQKLFSYLIILFIITLAFSSGPRSFIDENAVQDHGERSFDVFLNDNNIGTFVVNKKTKGDRNVYAGKAIIQPNIPLVKKLDYNIKSEFKDDILENSEVIVNVNGERHKKVVTTKENGVYSVKIDGEYEKQFEDPILFSSIRLFYEEPKGAERLYSEFHGRLHELKNVSPHAYEAVRDRGNTVYYYKENQLQKFHLDHWLADLKFITSQKQ